MNTSEELHKVMEHVSLLSYCNELRSVNAELFILALVNCDPIFYDLLKKHNVDVDELIALLCEVSEIETIDPEQLYMKLMNSNKNLSINVFLDKEMREVFYIAEKISTSEGTKVLPHNIISSLYINGSDSIKYIIHCGLDCEFDKFLAEYIAEVTGLLEESKVIDNFFEEHESAGGIFHRPKKSFNDFCMDLLEVAKKHNEPVVGREKEIDNTLRTLCRKTKNNVIYTGEAGVGKTALSIGIAKKILADDVPEKLRGSEFYSLDVGSLMAGTRFRGDLEERVKCVIDELKKKEKVILFIDEIHMLMGGSSDNVGNLANQIKTALTDSNIKFIGATTYNEYKNNIEKDNAFARRFKNIEIIEPSAEEAKEIIRNIITYYEEFHKVVYKPEAIDVAVDLSVKYIHDKYLPDKAIDIIDEAGAYLSKNDKVGGVVDVTLVETILAENCRIPEETISEDDNKLLLNLGDKVKTYVFGQDEAIDNCVNSIKLSRAGLLGENKPVASLLFVGQTGVGKTEIAKQLAKALNIDFVKFDMSEYQDQTSVNKLIGSSAGYVGYEDGGLLVEEIRKHPHCVLLLDEIEKAHPSVFNTFLQVMDDAKLTDNKGRVADFKNVIIIMTSNAGASGVKTGGLGFGSEEFYDYSKMDKAVESTFSPEFRNRLTNTIILNSMDDEMAKKIAERMLNKLKDVLESKDIKLTFTSDVVDYCVENGVTKEFGARPIQRLIDKDIKLLIVDDILSNSIKKCKLYVENNEIKVKK